MQKHVTETGKITFKNAESPFMKEVFGVINPYSPKMSPGSDIAISQKQIEILEDAIRRYERLEDIKKFSALALEDIENVTDEMIDRYGQIPEEVNNLLEIARIKELCKKTNVTKISQRRESIVFNFDADNFKMEIVDVLLKKYRNEIRFSPGKEPYITYKVPENSDSVIVKKVKEFLKECIK